MARKAPAQLDREIDKALVTPQGARVIADLERWGIDRAQIDEVRAAFRRGDHRRAMALARDLGWNRAAKRDRGGPYHATMSTGRRWDHRTIAQRHDVPEDVVRRIYAAVQTAKRQGLYGGHMADLIERRVGRKLIGGEYTVAARAKEHLGYDPPGGYQGPAPKGSAKTPPRAKYGDPKIERASRFVAIADTIIKDVLRRRRHPRFGWDETNDSKDRALLRQAADELEVAADLYEEAGAGVRAGTLHERARLARQGSYRLLAIYD